jgi:NhaA family Na+:H+ antiporter
MTTDRATQPAADTTGEKSLPELEYKPWVVTFLQHDMIVPGLLLASSIAALLTVNLGGAEWYDAFWHTELGLALGERTVVQSLHHWVNDGLMAIFFFVVGLEIKRELLAGELDSWRKALLPAGAAIGGVIVPAGIYLMINAGGPGAHGWGIPMATDIAFAAGCLSLMRSRVDPSLIVFVVALAIVDDLCAVAIIAVFYTDTIEVQPLLIGAILIILSFILGLFGVRAMWPYAMIGIVCWVAFLDSGVHATIAGVLLAFSVPHTARYRTLNFSQRMHILLGRFDEAEREWEQEGPRDIHEVIVNHRQQSLLRNMLGEVHHVEAPLQRLEHNLEPLLVFVILPLFAFANAGVVLDWQGLGDFYARPVTMGTFLGLVIGKPVGIVLAAYVLVKTRLADLPRGVNWVEIVGAGTLAGIGFTMSLFVNELAFVNAEHTDRLVNDGKLGIFLASGVSAVMGLVLLRAFSRRDVESKVGSAI